MSFVSIVVCLSLQFCTNANAFKKGNLIAWSKNNPIEWTDFRGASDKNSLNAAESNLSISYSFLRGKIEVRAYFNVAKSWSKNTFESDYLLEHERFHFNISELFARKMRKEMKELIGKPDLYKNVDLAFKELYTKHWEYQELYDKETQHSRNKLLQKDWESKVEKEMLELTEYSDPIIKIPRN